MRGGVRVRGADESHAYEPGRLSGWRRVMAAVYGAPLERVGIGRPIKRSEVGRARVSLTRRPPAAGRFSSPRDST
eukprot:5291240-Prymnesium_polylepis.1